MLASIIILLKGTYHPMYKKYRVLLTTDHRQQLHDLLATGQLPNRANTHARILLKADCGSLGPAWTDEQISDALDIGPITVHRVRQSFVEGGLEGALVRRPMPRRPRMLDGEQEAHLVALVCGQPPAGQARWSLRLLADKLVELEVAEAVSYQTVRRVLKKTSSSPGRASSG